MPPTYFHHLRDGTRATLAARKRQGWAIRQTWCKQGRQGLRAPRSRRGASPRSVAPVIREIKAGSIASLRGVAAELNARAVLARTNTAKPA